MFITFKLFFINLKMVVYLNDSLGNKCILSVVCVVCNIYRHGHT